MKLVELEVQVPRLQARFKRTAIKKAIEEVFVYLGYRRPTANQEFVIMEFLQGNDVFVCLPTGEGNSLCYLTLPLVFDSLRDSLNMRYD